MKCLSKKRKIIFLLILFSIFLYGEENIKYDIENLLKDSFSFQLQENFKYKDKIYSLYRGSINYNDGNWYGLFAGSYEWIEIKNVEKNNSSIYLTIQHSSFSEKGKTKKYWNWNYPRLYKIEITKEILKEDLINSDPSQGEGVKPDKKSDDKTKANLEKFMEKSAYYNGKSRNCSDMAKVGVKSSKKGFKLGLGKERYLIFSFTTPNSLFNDSKDFSNSTVLVDPGTKTDYSFSDGWVKPGVKQYLGKDVNEN